MFAGYLSIASPLSRILLLISSSSPNYNKKLFVKRVPFDLYIYTFDNIWNMSTKNTLPPHPQYLFGYPLTSLNCSVDIEDTPPKSLLYGRL